VYGEKGLHNEGRSKSQRTTRNTDSPLKLNRHPNHTTVWVNTGGFHISWKLLCSLLETLFENPLIKEAPTELSFSSLYGPNYFLISCAEIRGAICYAV